MKLIYPWCFFILKLHWQCSEKTLQSAQYLGRGTGAAGAWEQAPRWVTSTAGNDPCNFPDFTDQASPFVGEKKYPVMQGIGGIVFLQGKSCTFLQMDIHLYFGRSLGAQACWDTSSWKGDLVYLLKNVLILFVLSASNLLFHGIFQAWLAGSGLSGDLQDKVVCLLLPCCGHEDTEEDFADVEFWLKTRMQNFVICGFCQVLWVRLTSASRNWTDLLAQEGFISSLLMQWILWQLQRVISSFVW